VDLNKLIARVKAILLTPKTEWPVVAGEPTTVADLYKGYIVWLAAIPAVFTFIKLSMIGIPFVGTFGVGAGLSSMLLGYVLSLVMVYVVALIVDALAPTFGAQKDRIQALKTVAFAYTASWIAGIGQILPGLAWLVTIAGAIYSIYLLYLALPHTMKAPQDKAAGYAAASIVVAFLLNLVIGALVAGVSGLSPWSRGSVFSSVDNDVQFDKDSPIGKLEQWSKGVEEAGQKLEAAGKSGDQDAQAEALTQMLGAALGGGQVESLPTERLKPFVPESLGGMARTDFSVERNQAMGLQITEAKATYAREDGRSVNLEITDAGTAKGLLAFAGWAGMESESETSSGYEKTYRRDGRLVHERWDGGASSGEYGVVLGERFMVKVNGGADSIDDLKALLGDLDLRALEALKNEGVK
jgi:Yip1 domain